MIEHTHEHPPTHLGPTPDPNLPQREVVTPMGISKFQDAGLENNGYRYSFSKASNDRLVEIVYLKDDGSTGTIISDLDSLFDTKIVVNSAGKAMCRVTFKLLKEVTNPIQMHCADVPIDTISGGFMGKMLKNLLDYFLKKTYGLKKDDSKETKEESTEAVQSGVD